MNSAEQWLLLLVIGLVAVLPWVVIVADLPAVHAWRARRRARVQNRGIVQ